MRIDASNTHCYDAFNTDWAKEETQSGLVHPTRTALLHRTQMEQKKKQTVNRCIRHALICCIGHKWSSRIDRQRTVLFGVAVSCRRYRIQCIVWFMDLLLLLLVNDYIDCSVSPIVLLLLPFVICCFCCVETVKKR